MKQLLVSIAIVFASVLTVGGQNSSFSLSGTWDFQIDRQDAGVKEQWFNKSLDESINLPGSMPEKLKGNNVTARTKWTGSLYDSSYYFNPYMEKYRIEGQITFLPDSRQTLCRCRLVSKESDNSIRLERGANHSFPGASAYRNDRMGKL